ELLAERAIEGEHAELLLLELERLAEALVHHARLLLARRHGGRDKHALPRDDRRGEPDARQVGLPAQVPLLAPLDRRRAIGRAVALRPAPARPVVGAGGWSGEREEERERVEHAPDGRARAGMPRSGGGKGSVPRV